MSPHLDASQTFGFNFQTTYFNLPAAFYASAQPRPIENPHTVVFNKALSTRLGLDTKALSEPNGAFVLSGQTLVKGALPLAQAYAGHQFGHYTNLGDGRAMLLGEHVTPKNERFDIHLKGSGRTAYGRRGDGLAALGPMLREYLMSHAFEALGIPTTKSLAVVATNEPVYREKMLPGAILVRVASSHLRVGTCQYAFSLQKPDDSKSFFDYVIHRHDAPLNTHPKKYFEFLKAVMHRQAQLVAQWMLMGFIHGVMNTDNITLSGETLDFGPCAFMNEYNPQIVFSSIDTKGRYAYAAQPSIMKWNMARLAETLLPLLDQNPDHALALAHEALQDFDITFKHHFDTGLNQKMGLLETKDSDALLKDELLLILEEDHLDFTNTFRALSEPNEIQNKIFTTPKAKDWLTRFNARLSQSTQPLSIVKEKMNQANPFIIPRNHKVEEALNQAVQHQDYKLFEEMLLLLSTPFTNQENADAFTQPPPLQSECPHHTFCGT